MFGQTVTVIWKIVTMNKGEGDRLKVGIERGGKGKLHGRKCHTVEFINIMFTFTTSLEISTSVMKVME